MCVCAYFTFFQLSCMCARLGHTALSWAALKDRQSQMEALIKRGADVNFVSNKHGRSALIWAAMCGKHRSVSVYQISVYIYSDMFKTFLSGYMGSLHQ